MVWSFKIINRIQLCNFIVNPSEIYQSPILDLVGRKHHNLMLAIHRAESHQIWFISQSLCPLLITDIQISVVLEFRTIVQHPPGWTFSTKPTRIKCFLRIWYFYSETRIAILIISNKKFKDKKLKWKMTFKFGRIR